MKKTTREFSVCPKCDGIGKVEAQDFILEIKCPFKCRLCDGTGGIIIKETIEESDDMKEFIEKRCGWELVEAKSDLENEHPSPLTAKTIEKIFGDCVCPTPLGCYKHWLGDF